MVEAEADKWRELWQQKHSYQQLDWTGCEELPELLPEALRAAVASFPIGIGLGVDHIPPRALLRLSDEAMAALCKILMAVEEGGVG